MLVKKFENSKRSDYVVEKAGCAAGNETLVGLVVFPASNIQEHAN